MNLYEISYLARLCAKPSLITIGKLNDDLTDILWRYSARDKAEKQLK